MKFIHLFMITAGLGAGCTNYISREPNLEHMVGQMIMTGFHGNGTNLTDPDFAAISDQVRSGLVGGVILFDIDVSKTKNDIMSSNIQNLSQVQEMTQHLMSLADEKLLIAIDQEGGYVQRLKTKHGFQSVPSASELAQTTPENTYSVAYSMGVRLKDLGINVNFAPLLDVNVNPISPAIGAHGRSFSDDPDTVIKYAGAFANGLDDAGIAYSFKHFPGHGSAGSDSHLGLTDVTATYQDYELKPWQELLSHTSPRAMVMVAHIVNRNVDDVPASLSKKHIQMLRDMGFEGVVVSDDMDMGAIRNEYGLRTAVKMAINAGNDILIFGNNIDFDCNRGRDINAMIVEMVRDGEIPMQRIRESYRRIIRMKKSMK